MWNPREKQSRMGELREEDEGSKRRGRRVRGSRKCGYNQSMVCNMIKIYNEGQIFKML